MVREINPPPVFLDVQLLFKIQNNYNPLDPGYPLTRASYVRFIQIYLFQSQLYCPKPFHKKNVLGASVHVFHLR